MNRPALFRLVSSTASLNASSSDLARVGAVDPTVVANVSLIEWHEVIPFEPFGSESNVSSYLQWAIPISTITVRSIASSLSTYSYPQVRR
jgi:hypothetical protein